MQKNKLSPTQQRYILASKSKTLGEFQKVIACAQSSAQMIDTLSQQEREMFQYQWDKLQKLEAGWVVYGDEEYPQEFYQLSDPPLILFYKGHLPLLQTIKISIVGARMASLAAIKLAQGTAKFLGEAGCTIVSGLAKGIDAATHQGSLDSGTIAILGCGLDVIYPSENKSLFSQIAQKGLLLTEFPLGTPPKSYHFPQRNRLIAALSQSLIIIEAAHQSGSLVTAKLAVDAGKDIYVVPGFPTDPRFAGSLSLLKQGAHLFVDAQSFLDDVFQWDNKCVLQHKPCNIQNPTILAESGKTSIEDINDHSFAEKIFSCISHSPTTIDEIIRKCQTSKERALAAISKLELLGKIQKIGQQSVVRAQ